MNPRIGADRRIDDDNRRSRPRHAVLLLVTTCLVGVASAGPPSWTQWGGPGRDFTVDGAGLADRWPESGPRKLWSRDMGPGHSSILFEDARLYTMYRRGEQDVVVALNADTGETLWEAAYDAAMKPNMMLDYGPGPHSTPLIAGDCLITLSAVVQLHCFDKKTGKVLWKHDLIGELSASLPPRGYGASPIAYKDYVIVTVGAKDAGVIAFKRDTGEIAWKSQGLRTSYPSPIVVRINDEDHLVVVSGRDRVGLNPDNGEPRWQVTHDEQSASIMSTPMFIPPDKLFFSAAYGGGSYLTQVTAKDGKYAAADLWHEMKMRVHHESIVRIGETIYGSSGDFGPAFFMGMNMSDGKVTFRDRSFSKANVLRAGDKLIILDEDGHLALATAGPSGLNVISKADVLKNLSWTVPTLVGTRLFARDNHTIMALDLGSSPDAAPAGRG